MSNQPAPSQPFPSAIAAAQMEAGLTAPHRTALALALAALGLLLLLLANPPGLWLIPLSLVWLAYWLPIWRYGNYGQILLFAAASIALYGFERGLDLLEFQLVDSAYTLLMLAYLALGARYSEALRFATAYGVDDRPPSAPPNGWAVANQLLTPRWMVGWLAVGMAGLVLIAFPETRESVQRLWLKPAPARLIFILLALFFAWLVCRAILGWWARRKLPREVAQLEFRALFVDEFWAELLGVARRRAKPKFQLARRKPKR